ncbi:MAG: carbon monoxide dehydrogenase [Oscillospiraceae bacterium]|nr:carbon monoxide dehydrogenase [Oscillospiraceae bacterium]
MELYNSLIKETAAQYEHLSAKTWDYDPRSQWTSSQNSELVLQKDAAFELGASGKGSANFVLFTSSSELVSKDQVILCGKDLKEIKGDCDFARIVLLRIGVLDDDDEAVYRTLRDIEFAKYHVYPQGYMVRISPESYREQVRVSKDAIRRGISFKALGNNYITAYKQNPTVINATVIFITDPAANYNELKALAKKSSDVTGTLTHILEGLPTDCSVCALKDVCDEVEGMKELHFGVGAGGSAHKH